MSRKLQWSLLLVCALLFSGHWLFSQAIFSTVTGIVSDPSGAVIAGAQVTLTNAASGSTRQTVADAQGLYTFASVPVGTYNLSASHEGFQAFQEQGFALGGGEIRTINIAMKIGATSETVQITALGDLLTPVNTGEQTETLSTEQLQNYVQTGSDAAEFIKMMPGFGIQNGVSNQSAYTGEVIGINANGNGGSQSPLNNNFTYDGLPGNTLDIVSDGAHVSDPGCNCDTPVNPNSDFLQEFRVLSDDYSAEEQKGPMVITTVTKAGGSQFHGEAFMNARNSVLNANDSYFNATGAAKPADKFYYEGGNVGGPILKSRKKLFFFGGFEYFYQVLDTGVLTGTVPVPSMLTGDFSPATLSQLGPSWYGTSTTPATQYQVCAPGSACYGWPNGQMPANLMDPNMQALMKFYPAPNATPTVANGGFNYVQSEIFNQNDTQLLVRGDYDLSDNTKIWARYNWQTEIQPFPIELWGSNAVDQMPYPTSVLGRNRSDSIAATVTHVFSPTLTNEGVFAWTRILFPNVFADPSKVNPTTAGYNDPRVFQGEPATNMIPNFGGDQWSSQQEAGFFANYGGFYLGGPSQGLFADKWMPSFSDTVTKVWRTHTFAAGMFYEWIKNSQPDSSNTQGTAQFEASGNALFTYGDSYADELGGNLQDYSETNFNRLDAESYYTVEAFAQDSWVVKPRLTLNYGVRFTHFEPWVDDEGFGYSIFVPSDYSSANSGACALSYPFCGFKWHKEDSSVPLGGFPTRALFYQPRIGVAYDFHGNGNTVLRGGWGYFFYHTGQFTAGLDTSADEESTSLSPASIGVNGVPKQLLESQLNVVPATAVVSSPTPVSSTDSDEPYTEDWNVTLEQRTPWSGLLALAYIGNVSRDLPVSGGYGSDINLVPLGTISTANGVAVPGQANGNNFRPYLGYGQINTVVNNAYSNYNSLQVRWAHQSAKILMQLNYTWSKALGIVSCAAPTLGGLCGATLNPFNLQANYGPLPADRRQLFNAVYNFNLPSPIHDNKLVGGVVNGWQISGLTSLQSGANLTGNAGYDWNMNLNGAVMPGTPTTGSAANYIGNQAIFGSPDLQLSPLVTCDPKEGLQAHQFVNPNCFAVPTTVGTGGPALLPAEYGPAYFNSDLGIFKNFRIGSRESNKLQVRAEAQNFLNHPLWSFPNSNNLGLSFVQGTTVNAAGQTVGTDTFTQTNSNFGYTTFKQGHRIVELTAKYYF